MTNENLIRICEACQRRDRAAQKKLYETFRKKLYLVCLRYASQASDAQDMLQEGFISIFKDLHQFRPERGSLWHWMRRVMVNACLQHLRRHKKYKFDALSGREEISNSDEIVNFTGLSAKELLSYLKELPTGYRTVFNLYVMEGYSHTEIAQILGISVNTSKSQLSKGKAQLRKRIREGLGYDTTKLLVAK